MSDLMFTAEVRTVLGKKVSQLRRNGLIPGVVYGPVIDQTVQVSVNRRDFDRFYKAHGHTTLFTLTWDGGQQPVFIREVQQDPVRREPLHIDFFAPNLRQALRTMVQLVFHPPAEQPVGVLSELRSEVEIEALPSDVPNQLDVDLSSLRNVGDAIHVSDITAPSGVTILTSSDELLAHVVPLAVEAEPQVAEEAEVEAEAAAVEGAPAEGETSEE
jgi:large subunit ribosomal protein L25